MWGGISPYNRHSMIYVWKSSVVWSILFARYQLKDECTGVLKSVCATPVLPVRQKRYLGLMVMDFGLTSSAFGSVNLRTPFSNSASAFVVSTVVGILRDLEKRL